MKKEILKADDDGVIIPEEKINKSWYRRPANYELGQFDKDLETKREVSLTIPDMGYTPREILEKFTRGVPLDIQKEGLYDSPEDFEEDFENAVDITDVEERNNVLQNKIAAAKQSKVKGVVKGAEVKSPDITEQKEANEATT